MTATTATTAMRQAWWATWLHQSKDVPMRGIFTAWYRLVLHDIDSGISRYDSNFEDHEDVWHRPVAKVIQVIRVRRGTGNTWESLICDTIVLILHASIHRMKIFWYILNMLQAYSWVSWVLIDKHLLMNQGGHSKKVTVVGSSHGDDPSGPGRPEIIAGVDAAVWGVYSSEGMSKQVETIESRWMCNAKICKVYDIL